MDCHEAAGAEMLKDRIEAAVNTLSYRERIRQIKAKTIEKLQRPVRPDRPVGLLAASVRESRHP